MLPFSANMRIKEDTREIKNINGYEYKVVMVSVAKLEMFALFDNRSLIKEGDCIISDTVFLTNYDTERTPTELALLVVNFKVLPEESYTPMDYLDVNFNGRLIKSGRVKIKRVGVMRKPFLPCTVSIKNENGVFFNVLLIGFNKQAEKLNEIPTNTFINAKARLFRKMHQTGFELNLTAIDTVK